MSPLEAISLSSRRSVAHDAYTAWTRAQHRCGEALRAWAAATGPSRRALAFIAYTIELDREEQAADELERMFTHRLAA
jgi:hypothetical protein